MGLGTRIALFVGIPAAVIVAAGLLLRQFQPQITSGASAIGETLGTIVTQPVRGFFEQVENVLGDLPDTNIRIPGINITSGLLSFAQEEPIRDISGETAVAGGQDIAFGPGTTFDPNTGIIEGSPPTIIPSAEAAMLTPRTGTLPVDNLGRLSVSEIIEMFPQAVGLFDNPSTPQIEFLPLSEAALESFEEFGVMQRLTGQLFEEIGSTRDVLGA